MTTQPPVIQAVTSTATTVIDIPAWASRVDLVGLGGGGGGQGGAVIGFGNGGYGGRWALATIDLDEWLQDTPVVSIHVGVTVGAGGNGGPGGSLFSGLQPSKPGGDTRLRLYAKRADGSVYEYGILTAPGGKDATGNAGNMTGGSLAGIMNGQSVQGGNLSNGRDLQHNSVTYLGGDGAGTGGTQEPGGGGLGGQLGGGTGRVGADGRAWVHYYENPTHLKINIFECMGAASDLEVTPTKLGADHRYFNHTTVRGYYNGPIMGVAVTQGLAMAEDAIAANPGRFILVGTSQGAFIMSEVWKKLVSGQINRKNDCLGIFMFGNGLRETGRAFPGCNPVAPGHGIASAARRLKSTPDLIWEFAQPGDPICDIGDSPSEQAQTALMELLLGQTSPVIPIGVGITAIIDLLTGMSGAHNVYFLDSYKPIRGDNRSGMQILLDHLNKTVGPQHWLDYPIVDDSSLVCPDAGETREV